MDTTGKLKLGFAALMILSGIGVAMYPVVSNAVAQRHASAVIDSYDDTVQSMDTEKLDAAKEAARSYNEQLSNAVGRDAAGEAADTGTSYVDLMDVGESLGYIKIPKIDVNLPIYEGTSDEVLLKGVGHLEGSSYPLGGDSTHSVLTGHRGLAEAVLFTDLDKMQEGEWPNLGYFSQECTRYARESIWSKFSAWWVRSHSWVRSWKPWALAIW